MVQVRALAFDDPSPISDEGSLASQTRSLLQTFDAEQQDYADAVSYARWMADLLDRWVLRYGDWEDGRG